MTVGVKTDKQIMMMMMMMSTIQMKMVMTEFDSVRTLPGARVQVTWSHRLCCTDITITHSSYRYNIKPKKIIFDEQNTYSILLFTLYLSSLI